MGGQRDKYRKGQLSQERIELLESQNFVWDKYEAEWQDNFAALKEYVRKHEHARVPNGHKISGGTALGNWVGFQRRTYNKGQLSPERIALLESQKDWVWDTRKGPTSSKS